ncbi:MAG: LysR family transcriptional regulator [Clostridia bacterium]|nr:LysR family transcriptional regulator [Clostridia bacterium]MBR3272089.1 LysR family transcriptional regulator [Clostridia bacterium]
MNFQYYVNYIVIVEEGSLTSASRKLRVAQPALSNQVKAMEEVYGARLFHRGSGSHKLELTDAGRILYEKAKVMAEAEAAARSEINNCFDGGSSSLRVGIVDTLGNRYLMHALDIFSERNPETEIILREANAQELIKMLQNGLVETAFLRTNEQKFENLEVIFSQPDYLVASYRPEAFFRGNEDAAVSLRELAKFPLSATEEHLSLLRTAFREAGTTFLPKFVGSNTNACLMWAESGKGVALVPRLSLAMLGFEHFAFKTISDRQLDMPSLVLLAQKKQYRSRVINHFLEVCAEMNGDKITKFRAEEAETQPTE